MNELEQVGYIVLWHFDPPYKHARHCYDWVPDVHDAEWVKKAYGSGGGNGLIRAALGAKCKMRLSRKWPGTRALLQKVRSGGNAMKHCKECRREARMRWQDANMEGVLKESLRRARAKKR